MIDERLFKVNHIGKDGFIWWIGQVAPAEYWKSKVMNSNFTDPNKASKTWPERCKVRIVGYHSFRKNDLSDEDLPWAHIMIDPAFGNGQGGEGTTSNLMGGETCFGFFLDGDDAQQPIVVGLLYRHPDVQNYLKDDNFAFRPFTGHPGNIPLTKKASVPPSAPGEAPTVPSIQGSDGTTFTYNAGQWLSNNGISFNDALKNGLGFNIPGDAIQPDSNSAATDAFNKNTTISFTPPSNCNKNFIGQITQVLQDFIGFTNGLQKYANTYIDPVLNEIVDIGRSIKSVAYSIAGIIRSIINSIRSGLIKCIISLFKKFIGLVVPRPQQAIVAQATMRITDILFCLFEKLIPTIIDYIEDLLADLVDSVFAAPICAIEQWVAGILTNVMTIIEDSIDTIISGISWLTGGLTNVFNVLNQASTLANQIYSFIGCDSLKCKTPSKWVSNFGPSQVDADNWEKMVGNVNVIRGFSKELDSVDSAIREISLYGQSSVFADCNSFVNNPQTQDDLPTLYPGTILPKCIPPKISVYGDGIGARLNPIVGPNGAIIAVQIESGGLSYTSTPIIAVIDNSGYGKGAKLSCKLNEEGSITDVIIESAGSGYCPGASPYTNDGDEPEDDLDECKEEEPTDTRTYSLALSSSKNKVYEGDSFVITVNSTLNDKPKRIAYSISGVNSQDIKQELTGIIKFKDGVAKIKIDTVPNDIIDYKNLTFTLPKYNGPNKSISVFIEDITEKNKSKDYTLTSNKYSINEGATFKIKLKTKNLQDNTIVPFTISGVTEGLLDDNPSAFTVVNNKAEITFQSNKNIIANDEIFTLRLDNGEASIGISINKISTNSTNNQEITVCLKDLVVTRPGIGYSLDDYATDGVNKFKLIISPDNGAIFGVEPLSDPICGYTDVPTLFINTNTGDGATILPIMTVNQRPSGNTNSTIKPENEISKQIINVVDCI